jgi:macrolide transport system ATP-binding/permease protein
LRFFDKNIYWLEMMIRLRPGVTLEQAQAALSAEFHRFAADTAAKPKEAEVLPQLALEPGGAGLGSLRREYSKPLYVLMTMVGLILAIACAIGDQPRNHANTGERHEQPHRSTDQGKQHAGSD